MARELFDNAGKIVKFPRRFHIRLYEEVIILNLFIIFFLRIPYFYPCNLTFNAKEQIYIMKEYLFIRYAYVYLKAFD